MEPSAETVATVLDGIFIDAGIAIELNVGPQSRMAAIHLADYVTARKIDPATCALRFGLGLPRHVHQAKPARLTGPSLDLDFREPIIFITMIMLMSGHERREVGSARART